MLYVQVESNLMMGSDEARGIATWWNASLGYMVDKNLSIYEYIHIRFYSSPNVFQHSHSLYVDPPASDTLQATKQTYCCESKSDSLHFWTSSFQNLFKHEPLHLRVSSSLHLLNRNNGLVLLLSLTHHALEKLLQATCSWMMYVQVTCSLMMGSEEILG